MKNLVLSLLLLLAICPVARAEDLPDPGKIKTDMRRAFDWQLQHLTTTKNPKDIARWVHGAFMTGVMEAYRTTKDQAYLDYAWKWANASSWKTGQPLSQSTLPTEADNLVVSQSYIDLYEIDKNQANLQPTITAFDRLLAGGYDGSKLLWWCDSLYMLPAGLVRLSKVTGDPKYLREMERLYWESADFLYDSKEHLFYRDDRFMPSAAGFQPTKTDKKGQTEKFQEKNGQKMFWSRGNSWVLAGLARVLEDLPKDDPERGKFEDLFKTLAARVLELQSPDGLWRMGLLDPQAYDHGEVSGSALFIYSFAWGVRNGLLSETTYRPAIEKGWRALQDCQKSDGMVGYVQAIGTAPGVLTADSYQEYGTAAFLLAGCELLRLSDSVKAQGK